jgi:hypothetical protein
MTTVSDRVADPVHFLPDPDPNGTHQESIQTSVSDLHMFQADPDPGTYWLKSYICSEITKIFFFKENWQLGTAQRTFKGKFGGKKKGQRKRVNESLTQRGNSKGERERGWRGSQFVNWLHST